MSHYKTITEAVEYLKNHNPAHAVDAVTLRRYCRDNKIRHQRYGLVWVIDTDALDTFQRSTRGRKQTDR